MAMPRDYAPLRIATFFALIVAGSLYLLANARTIAADQRGYYEPLCPGQMEQVLAMAARSPPDKTRGAHCAPVCEPGTRD